MSIDSMSNSHRQIASMTQTGNMSGIKVLVVLGLGSVLTPPSIAQEFGYERAITGPGLYGAAAVFAADLDGDGDVDVLAASEHDHKIAWHENLGGGSFGLVRVIALGYSSEFVHAADLDGDGDLDVIGAGGPQGDIAWYENLGGGNFSAAHPITASASGTRSVDVADLDNDGDLDLLSASEHDDTVAWYENLGSGSFGTQRILSDDIADARSVHAADLDGDGDVDVLVGPQYVSLTSWFENLGGGVFVPRASTSATGSVVRAADLDGDGDLDLLTNHGWNENLGGGTFGPAQSFTVGFDVVFDVDLDRDGDTDVIVGGGDRVAWYENPGDGSFGLPHWINDEDYADTKGLFAADLDADGDIDILSALHGRNKIAWFENLGSSTFGDRRFVTIATDGWVVLRPADVDGDGDPDLLSSSSRDGKIAWYENRGGGRFDVERILLEIPAVNDMHAADIDGDGDLDVVFSTFTGDSGIAWMENLGNGAYGGPQRIATDIQGDSEIGVADLDQDGDLDVVDDYLNWFENLGTGTFTARGPLAPAELQGFTDLDGDGDIDILVTWPSTAYEVTDTGWCPNLGGGNFGAVQLIKSYTSLFGFSMTAGDLDGDGDQDVLSVYHQIEWFENLGNGVFAAERVIGPTRIDVAHMADMDGDGDLDVLSSTYSPTRNTWYENLGGGVFGEERAVSTSTGGFLGTFDMDTDGDVDLLAIGSYGMIASYENLGLTAIGERYCLPPNWNSTGRPAQLIVQGSAVAADNDVTLMALDVPQHSFGMFLTSDVRGFTSPIDGSQGALCLGGFLGRFVGSGQIQGSGAAGSIQLTIDLDRMPTGLGFATADPGETWSFQAWYRDVNPTATSNFTDAVAVTLQ